MGANQEASVCAAFPQCKKNLIHSWKERRFPVVLCTTCLMARFIPLSRIKGSCPSWWVRGTGGGTQIKDRSRTWPHYKVDRTPSELPQPGQALGIWGSERAGSQHPESGMWKIELCPQLFNSLMSKEEWANWQGRRANQIMVSGGSFSLDKRISIFMEESKKKKN